MPVGYISWIKIGTDWDGNEIASVNLDQEGLFFLWWTNVFTDPFSWLDGIKYSMWISLLKEALTNNLEVELLTDDDETSLVKTIKLLK